MADFYNQDMEVCKEEEAQYALLDINEYNGLRKVLRLYREQKGEKTHKSDSRYKVLEQQTYKHQDDRTKFVGWRTTLLTPYFGDLDYGDVEVLVQGDLEAYLGVIRFYTDTFGVNAMETKISMEIQNYRYGKLEESDYGIFYANLRYNGRNNAYELQIKSIRRIPLDLITNIE